MKKRFYLLLAGEFLPFLMFAQLLEKLEEYDIFKDKVLYTISYAYLDTDWKWE